MSDTTPKVVSPAAIAAAEKARPNWKAVAVNPVATHADASTPELNTILHKYFGANAARADAPAANTSELVTLAPANETTTRVGHKVVLVQNGHLRACRRRCRMSISFCRRTSVIRSRAGAAARLQPMAPAKVMQVGG